MRFQSNLKSLAFYLFSSTCLINPIKHEHSCKILYLFHIHAFGPFRIELADKEKTNNLITSLAYIMQTQEFNIHD